MTKSNRKLISLLLAGHLLIGGIASGQLYKFDAPDTNGNVNVKGIGAEGSVNFDLTNPGSETVSVSIWNTSDASVFENSYITGFYILKPWADESGISYDLTGVPGSLNWLDAEDVSGNGDYNGIPDVGNLDKYFFFGATVPNKTEDNGLAMGAFSELSPAVFDFDLGGVDPGEIDLSVYSTQGDMPHIIVRWQAIDVLDGVDLPIGWSENGRTGGSAKGYSYFTPPGQIIIVPEPSEIAAIALLGIGFLLWTRRSFSKKLKKG